MDDLILSQREYEADRRKKDVLSTLGMLMYLLGFVGVVVTVILALMGWIVFPIRTILLFLFIGAVSAGMAYTGLRMSEKADQLLAAPQPHANAADASVDACEKHEENQCI